MSRTFLRTFEVQVTVNRDLAQGDEFELALETLGEALEGLTRHDPAFVRYDIKHLNDLSVPS